MLIDGEKWACEACVRGHRVTTCKHHDRPLMRINRKGRPFSTCSVCNCTPCEAPEEHTKLRREAESKSQSSKRASSRPSRPNSAFLPIAPRPSPPTAASPATAHSPVSRPGSGNQSGHDHAHADGRQPSDMAHLQSMTSSAGSHHLIPPSGPATTTSISMPPLQMPVSGSFPPSPLISMADIPVSMPMMDDLSGRGALLFGESDFMDSTVFGSLEDLDVGALHDEVLQEDWSSQFWISGDDSL